MSVFPQVSPSIDDSSVVKSAADVASEAPAPPYLVPEGAEIGLSAGEVSEPTCSVCLNCGCERAEEFCPRCGQESTDPVVPLRYLLRDAIDEVFKVDGRIWATMRAVLFQPGKATRDFLDGKRTAYIGPLKLYFAVSTVYFLVFTAMGGVSAVQRKAIAGAQAGMQQGRAAAALSSDKVSAPASPTVHHGSAATVAPPSDKSRKEERTSEIMDRFTARMTQATMWFTEHMSLINLALLPLFAAQLSLLYSRRRRELPFVAHVVFTLYTQSALYIFYLPLVSIRFFSNSQWGTLCSLVAGTTYSYFALRRAFDGPVNTPWWRTAFRALLWVAGQLFAAMLLGGIGMVAYLLWP